jgi:hypothetical protein
MSLESLFQSIYQLPIDNKNALIQVDKDIQDYPAYPLAHLFRLHCTSSNEAERNAQIRKAGLHVSNPMILQNILHSSSRNNPETTETMHIPSIESTPNTPPENNSGDAAQSKEEMLFEPLYMSDYFASQGIKLSEDQLQKDQLGKQLRSFTEWLKTMKKTPGHRAPVLQTPLDPKVEKLAEQSNLETDVTTESMAEVLVEQGKLEKAIQIYEKLSLQFPAKSVYFARKISSLK